MYRRNYINERDCDMLITYAMANENAVAARELHLQKFLRRTGFDVATFRMAFETQTRT